MTTYRFGNTSFVFECDDEEWLSHLRARYRAFHDERPDNVFEVRYQPTDAAPPAPLTSPRSTCLEAPAIALTERGFTAETATTSATVDLEARRARLSGPCALYPLDNLLRHLLPSLGEQGAVVHGAALASGEAGVLACGPSGAGKTTLASLAGDYALCDELAAVSTSAPADRRRLTSLPFWRARPGSARLEAVLLLRHGRENRLAPLGRAEALRRLSYQILWPVAIPRAMDRALGHVSSLLADVRVFDFAFTPRPDAWSLIEEQVLS